MLLIVLVAPSAKMWFLLADGLILVVAMSASKSEVELSRAKYDLDSRCGYCSPVGWQCHAHGISSQLFPPRWLMLSAAYPENFNTRAKQVGSAWEAP